MPMHSFLINGLWFEFYIKIGKFMEERKGRLPRSTDLRLRIGHCSLYE